MTDKLKCPFCGVELLGNMTTPYCPNPSCKHWSFPMSSEIWQALISGKKAQDALKEIIANPHGAACHNYCRAKRVLEEIGEITSITKQKKRM